MKYLLGLYITFCPLLVVAESEEELAYKHAPIIFQDVDAYDPRLDYISGVDFDGDLTGNNNWEDAVNYELKPIVYYSVVSTESHHFITYSIFHPRDWTTYCTGLFYECHENDMENMQIVVDRQSDQVVALVTQAHLWSSLYLQNKNSESDGSLIFVNENGKILKNARVGVYIESGGHAIYGLDGATDIIINKKNVNFSDETGIIYYPSKYDNLAEPDLRFDTTYPYRLESTLVKFWEPVLDGKLFGIDKLFNGSFDYSDSTIAWEGVPRYFDSDMQSGIGKSSSGIVPFAMGFSLLGDDLGGLFFNPAYHFKMEVSFAANWSTNYTYHPYR